MILRLNTKILKPIATGIFLEHMYSTIESDFIHKGAEKFLRPFYYINFAIWKTDFKINSVILPIGRKHMDFKSTPGYK